jgi:hypothetical protein
MSSTARFAYGRPMRKGSYKLPGGGDRVRLSRALKAELLGANLIEQWPKTNARRVSKAVDSGALKEDFERTRAGLIFADWWPLLAVLSEPESAAAKARAA